MVQNFHEINRLYPTYLFFLQVLRNWGQKSLSNSLNEAGRKLLSLEAADPSKDSKELEKGATLDTSMDNGEPGSINLQVSRVVSYTE